MDGLKATKEYKIETPFGLPSAPVVVGTLENQRVAFLARHGVGHHIMPSDVPYRANIYALKSLGVERGHQHQRLRFIARRLHARPHCHPRSALR